MSVRVLIVEDDKEDREEYRMLIKERGTMQLLAETDDPEEALCMLEIMYIDALILDLELPKGSGILFLEKMQMLNIDKPFIAVVTNVVSRVIYDTIRGMGVDYICTKGDKDFSLNVPLSIIEISAPYRRSRAKEKLTSGKVNLRTRREIYRRNIEEEMIRLGFSNKMSGTAYCQCAILFILMSENMNVSMTKEVYPYVATEYKVSARNVERSIRIVIEKVWTEQDIRKLEELYPYEWDKSTGRPTNAEFMHNMIKKILR